MSWTCRLQGTEKKSLLELVGDLHGEVLEAGVGTGRNFKYYPSHVKLTALDFSPAMLRHATRRRSGAACSVRLLQDDACDMTAVEPGRYDWVVSTFLCCVLPAGLQTQAIAQFERVLEPGGRFRLLEMVYSKDPALRRRQDFSSPGEPSRCLRTLIRAGKCSSGSASP